MKVHGDLSQKHQDAARTYLNNHEAVDRLVIRPDAEIHQQYIITQKPLPDKGVLVERSNR